MAILQTGQTFSSGDQVTAQKLMDIADLATFSDPADGSTIIANNATYGINNGDGKLKVKANGIGSNELLSDASVDDNRAVTTNHIKDDAVTSDKLAHISNLNVLGNVSGSDAAPVGVEIKDEDNMASDSETALATQQSIKAYVDNEISVIEPIATSFTSTTPTQLNSATYEDIFNETVSIVGTHAIFFKVALENLYYGDWDFQLLVGGVVIDQTGWQGVYGDGNISKAFINLMGVSSSLTSTTVQVRYIRNSGPGDADMISTAKLIII